ncbi:hypothetical protein [Rhizobium binae]|uniref:hypothetical protein n=1 Tax=Rhizobium binae TaxID=1138190 RepID=UPI001C82D93B|nr:hypothetical protein [Rhizobium binae]MBX4967185.1 hypothetical protein [Rhizobium binae]
MKQWPPGAYDQHLAEFGRIVFNFNTLEGGMKAILSKVSTDWSNPELRARNHILITNMGNMDITDALRTIVNEFNLLWQLSSETKKLILHCITTFDLTREYRNWYVHGLNAILSDGKNFFVGMQTFSARNRFAEHFLPVSLEDLTWFAGWCYEASHHIAEAHSFIAHDVGYDIGGQHALPEIWSLPDRLKKPVQYLLDNPLPPESSLA